MTILVTFFIYIRTGRQIYRRYKQLRSLHSGSNEPEPHRIVEPFSTKTTEVYVTSETVMAPLAPDGAGLSQRASVAVGTPSASTPAYSVTITAHPRRPLTPKYDHDDDEDDDDDEEYEEHGEDIRPTGSRIKNDLKISKQISSTPTTSLSPLSPTSPTSPSSTIPDSSGHALARTLTRARRRNRRKLAVYEANNAAWSYTQCALLFFTALLVTWIPSTANRVYSVVNNNEVSLGLQYASAFVLPLQGFWNGLIYIFTTRRACKVLLREIQDHIAGKFAVRTRDGRGKVPTEAGHELDDGSNTSWDTKGRGKRNSSVLGFTPSRQ